MQATRRFDPFGPVAYYTTPPEQALVYDSYVNLAEVIAVHFFTTRGVKRATIHLAHHQHPAPEVRDSLVLTQLRARLERAVRDDGWFQTVGPGTEQSTHFLNLNQVEAVRFYRLEAFPDETLAVVYAGNHEGPYELNRVNTTRDDLSRLEALCRGEVVAPGASATARPVAPPAAPPPSAPPPAAPPPPPAAPPPPAPTPRPGGLAGRLPLPQR